jgi:hypothetical protein
MRWLPIAIIAAVTAGAVAIAATYYLQRSDDAGLGQQMASSGLSHFAPSDCELPSRLPLSPDLVPHDFAGVEIGIPRGIDIRMPSPNGSLPGGSSDWSDGGRTFVITVLPSVAAYQIGPSWIERYRATAEPTLAPLRQSRPAESISDIVTHQSGERGAGCVRDVSLSAGHGTFFGDTFGDVSYEAFIALNDGRLLVLGIEDGRKESVESRKLDFLSVLNSVRLTQPDAIR